MLRSTFTSGAIRRLAGERCFRRGEVYALSGRVKKLKASTGEATATVRGSRTYIVRLWVEGGGPRYSCTCPVGDAEEFCKHCVAVGLVLAQDGGGSLEGSTPASRDDLRRKISEIDRAALVDLVTEYAEGDDILRGRLLLAASKASGDVDVERFREAVANSILVHDFVDYRSMYAYSSGIEEVIDSIEGLLTEGHAVEVVDLCEHALGCLEDALGRVDDSDGYMGTIRDRLVHLHLAACKTAKPDPEELAQRLFEWEVHSDWETFLGAAKTYKSVLGKKGLARYTSLAEEVWDRVPPIAPGEDREHSSFRFNITYAMQTLAELSGDVDRLAAVKAKDLSSPYRYVEIAEIYKKARRYDDSLSWAERGLKDYPDTKDFRLIEVLADEYQRRARHEEAMSMVWASFTSSKSLSSYERLAKYAGKGSEWEAWRERALALLRAEAQKLTDAEERRSRWAPALDHSTLVQVFLWEEDVESAWGEAKAGGCSPALWLELARLREKDHPDEVIPIYQDEVERTIGEKNNRAYADAVALMWKVRKLMQRASMDEEFPKYVQQVKEAHKPKRNLMKLLDKTRW